MKRLFPIVLLSTLISAHNIFQKFSSEGEDFDRSYVRQLTTNRPIQSSATTDKEGNPGLDSDLMACNRDGDKPAEKKAKIAAGSEITLEFHPGTGADSGTMDVSHHGPTLLWMGKVDNALTATGAGVDWFKVFEEGIIDANDDVSTAADGKGQGTWATDKLRENGGKFTARIPKNIPSGDYLIRPELIALHGGGSLGGAQLYFGCGQVTITGGTDSGPKPHTVKFPGGYKPTDPGLYWSMWGLNDTPPNSQYKPPGPPVFGSDSDDREPITLPPKKPVQPGTPEKSDPKEENPTVPLPDTEPKAPTEPDTPVEPTEPEPTEPEVEAPAEPETPAEPEAPSTPTPPPPAKGKDSKAFWEALTAWFKKMKAQRPKKKKGSAAPTTLARSARR